MRIAALACLFALASPLAAAVERIAPGVHLLRGTFTPGTQPDGNSVILEGSRGLVLVDTGRHAAHTQQLANFVAKSRKPLAAIVNTHWHLDHIGGNVLLRSRFPKARVLGSDAFAAARTGFMEKSRRGLLAEIERLAAEPAAREPFEKELALLDAGAALAPSELVAEGRQRVGGRRLIFHLARNAATAADVWLLDEKTKTLIAGDLVTLPAPFLDTACPAGWQAALARLSAADFTILVPGHGPPMTRAQFETWRGAYDALLACAASGAAKSECVAGWMASAGTLIAPSDEPLARAMIDYYVEQHLRNQAGTAELCAQEPAVSSPASRN